MKTTWWKEVVVYQVYWRSFYDSNGDGYGDLKGLILKLDYIKDLGADAIWLNPCYESPDKDNGYDISDFTKIMDKAGNMEDWERLLFEVHQRGMKLIMDLVVNHTSNLHPWFLESRSSKDNPKRDWYIWRGDHSNETPNNWRSYFTPSSWEWDEHTGQYYFHSFAVEQPDLNWKNPELRNEIYRMMRYWLDKGIDGFRLDAIALLAKPASFPNSENPEDIRYLTNNPGVHEYLQEMNQQVFRHYDMMTVGEVAYVDPDEGLKYVSEDRNELQSLFHFEIADEMPSWDILKYKKIQQKWHRAFYGKGWNSHFLNNHDHTRQVSRYGNDREYRIQSAKMLATLVHTLPGTPYIYQGEEIGMTGVRYESIDDYQDIAMKNKYAELTAQGNDPEEVLDMLRPLSRDNSRTPMQWDGTPNAGFTTGIPWIKINPNYRDINAEQSRNDPDSIYHYYKKLITLRKSNPVMIYGDYEDLLPDDLHIYAFIRKLEHTCWLIVLNHSTETNELVLPGQPKAEDFILGNYPQPETNEHGLPAELRPFEAVIYQISS